MNTYEKRILFFASASHFLTHFFMLIFPVLIMPISRALNLPLSLVVNLSFWMYFLYGTLAMLWGWLSDHLGHKWAMASGMILAGFGLIMTGFLSSLFSISLAFALVGIGCSAYHPSGIALVSQGVRQRGKAMGINGIWGNAGMASVPFLAGLLNYLMGWQKSLVVFGTAGIIFGIVCLIAPLSIEKGTDRSQVSTLERKTAGKLFLIICIGLVFSGFMYRSFTVILPAFLEYRLGSITEGIHTRMFSMFPSLRDSPAFNTLAASLIATSVYLVGIIGQAIGGRVADRFSLKCSYFVFFCLALPFILGMAMFKNFWLVVCAGIFVLFSLGMQPIENSIVAFLTPARWRSVSYGLKFTLTFGAGSFAVKLVSLIEASYGMTSIAWLISGFLVLIIMNTALFLYLSRGYEIRQ